MKTKIYTYFTSITFGIIFFSTYPIQLVLVQKKKWHKHAHKLNKLITVWVCKIVRIPIEIEYKFIPEKKLNYIFCPNHSSYLDIPSTFFVQDKYLKFVGKHTLVKIPFFGYMFKKLYIPVNRKNKESKIEAFNACRKALEEKHSIVIYPEGTIPANAPKMIPFKDGAFKLSVEYNIPIVPVTLPNNWDIFDPGKFLLKRKSVKIIVHEPLNTAENPINDYKILKQKTFEIIENELNKQQNNEN